MRKWIFLAIIIVPIILLSRISEKQSGDTSVAPPPSFMENVKVENRKNGVNQWTLSTDRTVFSQNGTIADMENVKVDFPSDEMTVRADTGSYDTEENRLILSGNIRAQTDDYTIKTKKILLRSDGDEIFTDEKVFIEGNGFRIEGEGLSFANKIIRLLNNVKAEFF